MFSSLSKFHISEDSPLPFFTSYSIDLSPPTPEMTSSVELDTLVSPSDHPTSHVSPPDHPTPSDLSYDSSSSTTSSSHEPPTTATPNDNATPVDPVSQSAVPPPTRQSTRVRELPRQFRDYHCYSTIFSHHEPSSYKESSSNPLWQQCNILYLINVV